jgi:hypothetical protein
MVLEALWFGRHVLWTQDFPFTGHITSYADMLSEVRKLLERHKRGELKPQIEAAHSVQQQYSPKRCTLAIARAWSEAAHKPTNAELAVESL